MHSISVYVTKSVRDNNFLVKFTTPSSSAIYVGKFFVRADKGVSTHADFNYIIDMLSNLSAHNLF